MAEAAVLITVSTDQHLYCYTAGNAGEQVDFLSHFMFWNIHLVRLQSTRRKAAVTGGDKSCCAN